MAIRYPMAKKLVNQKRDELKSLSNRDLVDRILSYANQDLLNADENGQDRPFPVRDMADRIREKDYKMSEKQYYTLIHHFAAITVPHMKIVGVTYHENDPAKMDLNLIEQDGRKRVYEAPYTLRPEPENPYDPNAVAVWTTLKDGSDHQVGYLSKEFVAAHPMLNGQTVQGNVVDWSNGHFKMVSYQLALDIEPIDNQNQMREENLDLNTGLSL